jgi:type VI secretion system protein ImpE
MDAQELIGQGRLHEALAALQERVRKEPGNARYRTFLFQLLCVLGQWQRALTQLNVVAELDAGALPMVQTYREAIQCEVLRGDVFLGKRQPLVFGEPRPWLAQLIQALQCDAADDLARAADLRGEAFEAAPANSGSIDGNAFAWLADADVRLGPVLEAIINGKYFWVPMYRIARIEIEPPADLRDAVWTPASFTWINGAATVGLIPTRYERTTAQADEALLAGRRTEWVDRGAMSGYGLGQRMLASDGGEYALRDVRLVEFEPGEPGPDGEGAAND